MRDWTKIRPSGQELPFIPLGPFKLRFPGVHYKFEIFDFLQGLVMCAVCLSIINVLQDSLGMPFEVALSIVVLNGFLYLWHTLLGDPVIPGWITPAIPLIVAYVGSQPAVGPDRMHALIAFQMTFAAWCLFLGITGLGKKVITIIPAGIKAGVILGAGISAIQMVFAVGGRFDLMPITISLCALLAMYTMYNAFFRKSAEQNRYLKIISNLGLLPAVVLAIIIGGLTGEAHLNIEWGISRPDFHTLWTDWVPWGTLGWPSFDLFLKSIPLVLSTYIVVFGDVLQVQAIIADGRKVRPDDPAEYSVNRTHLIVGIRNGFMGFFGPDMSMCGPLWAAMMVVIVERWKKGRQTMESLLGGAASFRFGTFTGYLILPIVTLTRAILPAALALTMFIQGFVSVYVGVKEAKNLKDLGIAGLVAGTLVSRGAAWGFAVGILSCLVIYGSHIITGGKDEPPIWIEQK